MAAGNLRETGVSVNVAAPSSWGIRLPAEKTQSYEINYRT